MGHLAKPLDASFFRVFFNPYHYGVLTLLIPARGTAIRVAVFKEQSYPCIASSNVIVIRAKSKELNPTYLKVFFDSSLGRKILLLHQQGMYIQGMYIRYIR